MSSPSEIDALPNEIWQEGDGALLVCVVPGKQWMGFGAPYVPWDSAMIERPLRRLMLQDGTLDPDYKPADYDFLCKRCFSRGHPTDRHGQ